MADCHEVWGRGCPPRTAGRRLHILASLANEPAYLELAREFNFDKTVESTIKLSGKEAFAHELRCLEECATLIVDVNQSGFDWLVSVGYAMARGKTVIAVGDHQPGMFRLQGCAYFVKDLVELKQVLKGLSKSG